MGNSPSLIDRFGRTIDYLRISVTDRCNFRCIYCMPEEGVPPTPKQSQLTGDELRRVIHAAGRLGMRKARFTGGEPLLRNDLADLVRTAKDAGFVDISLTTNGFGLEQQAQLLREAGLNRVNVSLDTLTPEKFRRIARRGEIEPVRKGIAACLEAGLHPVKINVVALKGFNDDETVEFARWTVDSPVHIRWIELMPIRWNLDEYGAFDPFSVHGSQGKPVLRLRQAQGSMLNDLEMRRAFIDTATLRKRIEAELGPLEPAHVYTNGPARTFRLPHSLGTIGFISQISDDLCKNCNRLRLTADGFLRPCLMSDGELDLKLSLRDHLGDEELEQQFRVLVGVKPERHELASGQKVLGRNMSQLGG